MLINIKNRWSKILISISEFFSGSKNKSSAKFRKKPVDAIQWNGKNFDEVCNFMQDFHGHKLAYEDAEELAKKTGEYYIKTLDGVMTATKNDWIIKGDNGEFYPCKPNIFKKTYEIVNNDNIKRKTF